MSLETPTWDKIIGALSSTTSEFGGNWANLISDYYNGVNIALLDASKIPIIGTFTRYKFEKLGIFDVDQSHSIIFSVDDIDTGSNRKIKFRRMNTPFEEDYAVLEGMGQTLLNKTINADLNTITNIENADVKAAAGIIYSKLNLTNSILAADLTADSVITVKILDANVTLAKMASNSVDSSKIVDGSVVNADINAAAAIVYSKLSLSNSILNADINSAAAIAWTKISKTGSVLSDIADTSLASLAQYDLIMRNGSTQWAKLSKGSNSTALTVDASGVVAYTTITNAMLAGSIAYSKLTLTGSILNADVNASAAIVTSKLADSANFILKTLDNSFGAHYFDMTRISAPSNPSANDVRFYTKQIDTNNDGYFMKIKKNGSFVEVQIA